MTSPSSSRDDRVETLRDRIHPAELTSRGGIPCARPVRALFDQARKASDVREAVVGVDMMAAAELVSVQQLRSYLNTVGGVRGVPQVRAAVELASEHSRSPGETRTRLVWVLDAGLATPLVNQPVFDRRGNLLGIADLLDPVAGVVGEYDGADHRSALRHSRDVDREARLRDAGLEVFRVTGPDLREPGRIVERIHAARRRARWLGSGAEGLDPGAPTGLVRGAASARPPRAASGSRAVGAGAAGRGVS